LGVSRIAQSAFHEPTSGRIRMPFAAKGKSATILPSGAFAVLNDDHLLGSRCSII
jgi:hypothetical protein